MAFLGRDCGMNSKDANPSKLFLRSVEAFRGRGGVTPKAPRCLDKTAFGISTSVLNAACALHSTLSASPSHETAPTSHQLFRAAYNTVARDDMYTALSAGNRIFWV